MPNLAAKYRPKTWDEVVEQKFVIKMVKGLIEDTHMDVRNFLFTGPAGCAKTTICRILANVLNEGKGEPIEIDAASNSGVDSMRVIIDQARSYPVGTKWKIFIIDEVHSFSNAAWQAALKTFEEVPAKTIFLMATTNPEKIPETILSRVQQFRLSKISVAGIENRLKYIVEQENKEGQSITYTDDAISYIAKMANGGMRDAITLLEKAIASDKNITSESLMSSLGLPNYDEFFELLQAYASKDNTGIARIVDTVYNSGVNFAKWMTDFHAFTINVVKYILLQDISRTMIPGHYEAKIKNYGSAHLMICLILANKLVKLNNELRFSQYQQELTLTYLCSVVKK
jgi:DNA polymerase-3 subunit gamma/tau